MPPTEPEPRGRYGPPDPAPAVPPLPAAAPTGTAAADPRAGLLLRRQEAGRAEATEAVRLLEALAREMVAGLGRYDRDTLTTWRALAWYRDEAGDPGGAHQLLAQVVPDLVRALGPTDPDTLQARYELAVLTGTTGRPQDAAYQLHFLVPDLAAALGPYDERVFRARHDLALQLADTGDLGAALHQLREVVPLIQQTLGESHPLLADTRLDLGRYSELWALSPAGRGAGLGWAEAVAIVHRLMVWDFETDREADACLRELERRTGAKGLMDRVFLAPEHLTAEQVAAVALGVPTPGMPGPPAPPGTPWTPPVHRY